MAELFSMKDSKEFTRAWQLIDKKIN